MEVSSAISSASSPDGSSEAALAAPGDRSEARLTVPRREEARSLDRAWVPLTPVFPRARLPRVIDGRQRHNPRYRRVMNGSDLEAS